MSIEYIAGCITGIIFTLAILIANEIRTDNDNTDDSLYTSQDE